MSGTSIFDSSWARLGAVIAGGVILTCAISKRGHDWPRWTDLAGLPASNIPDRPDRPKFTIDHAHVLMTGFIDPRGVVVDQGSVWVADGPRAEAIRFLLDGGITKRLERIVPCPESPEGSIDMRGMAAGDTGERSWIRHDLQSVEGQCMRFPFPIGPSGLAALSTGGLMVTGDDPSPKGSLVYAEAGLPAKVLDKELRNPTGIALGRDEKTFYLAESAAWETRWLEYNWDSAGRVASRGFILGTVPRASGKPPAFEGIAVFKDYVFAGASDGLYIFRNHELRGKLGMENPVTGVDVDRTGLVYFASGNSLLSLCVEAEGLTCFRQQP